MEKPSTVASIEGTPRKAELARTLSNLEDAVVVAIEEIEAICDDDEWFSACKTGRVRASRSHLYGILRKINAMREAAGIETQPERPEVER